MEFIQGNYFKMSFGEQQFDGIITDPPYKSSIKNVLYEQNFDVEMFMKKTDLETKRDSFLITFTNFFMGIDLINLSKNTNWNFKTFQIWNKEPTRNFISWSYPLRTCEFIYYFTKGNFKLSFKNGIVGEPYKRNSFGGSLRATIKNTKDCSEGMYSEVITFKQTNRQTKDNKHPTQKPVKFSEMFSKIVGNDKFVLDPFCGSGNLIFYFPMSIGIDIKNYQLGKLF